MKDEALSRSLAERDGVQALVDVVREHREGQYTVVTELERITGDLRRRVALSDLCQESELTLVTEECLVQLGADESAVVMMRPASGTRMKPVLGPDGSPLPQGVRRLDRWEPVRSDELELHPVLRLEGVVPPGGAAALHSRRLSAGCSGVPTPGTTTTTISGRLAAVNAMSCSYSRPFPC